MTLPRGPGPSPQRAEALLLMENMPDDVLSLVFSHLDERSLAMAVPRVCRRWRGVCALVLVPSFDLSGGGPSFCPGSVRRLTPASPLPVRALRVCVWERGVWLAF